MSLNNKIFPRKERCSWENLLPMPGSSAVPGLPKGAAQGSDSLRAMEPGKSRDLCYMIFGLGLGDMRRSPREHFFLGTSA